MRNYACYKSELALRGLGHLFYLVHMGLIHNMKLQNAMKYAIAYNILT